MGLAPIHAENQLADYTASEDLHLALKQTFVKMIQLFYDGSISVYGLIESMSIDFSVDSFWFSL